MSIEEFIKEECELNPIITKNDEHIVALVWDWEIHERIYPSAQQGSVSYNAVFGCIQRGRLTPIKEVLSLRDKLHPCLESKIRLYLQ